MSEATAMTTIDDVDDAVADVIIEPSADHKEEGEEGDLIPPSPDHEEEAKEEEDVECQDEAKDEQVEEVVVKEEQDTPPPQVNTPSIAAPALQVDGKSLKRNNSVGNSASWILRLFESQVKTFSGFILEHLETYTLPMSQDLAAIHG